MEPISSIASVLQVLSYAATAAVKVTQFINDVKHAPEAHDELKSRLDSFRKSLKHLTTVIQEREARLDRREHKHRFRQEEQDILQEARDIRDDCERCAKRLEDFSRYQNGSLMKRLKRQIMQGIKRPEIQRLESRIQTNVGTMQLLLLILKTFVHDDQFERERLLLDIRQQTGELKLLKDSFANTLKQIVLQSEHIEDIRDEPRQTDWPLSMTTDEDGHDLMRTTNRTLETADSLVDKLSRIGSDTSLASLDSESLLGGVRIQVEATAPNTTVQWIPTPTNHLTLELMTSFLDEYIEQAKKDLASESLDECEKNLNSAIKCGVDRFHQHGQAFEQWFELQLLLAEVYQMQGKSTDAQNLILGLMQSTMETGPEYSRITSLRKAQLYYARANFCLDEYYKCHNITLSDLENIAREAYIFVENLNKQNEVNNYPGDTLSQLLANCAQIWSQVTGMQGEKVKQRVIQNLHPKSNGPPQWPHSFPIQPGTEIPAHRRHSSLSNLERQGVYSTSPSGHTITYEAPSDTAPTEPSSPRTGISGFIISRGHDLTTRPASLGDVEETNSAGLTPLLVAAKQGDWELMAGLVKRLSANVNAKDRDGMTALHHALRGMNFDEATIKLLLARNIDVNAADTNGDTALHYCVKFQHPEAARILLKSGRVDLEARNEKGQTAAVLAASRDGKMNTLILEPLLSYGAKLDTAAIPREMRSVVAKLKARQGVQARRESQSSSGQRNADPVRPSNASQQSSQKTGRTGRWLPFSAAC